MAGFTITATNHTSFTVSDLDRTVKFYTDVLGFDLLNRSKRNPEFTSRVVGVPGAQLDIAYVQAPGHRLELIEYIGPDDKGAISARPCDSGFAHIAFDVDNIEAVVAAVAAAGVAPISSPQEIPEGPNKGGFAVYTRDPDGCTIEFIQRPT